jgi:hypothetical protein
MGADDEDGRHDRGRETRGCLRPTPYRSFCGILDEVGIA